MKTSLVVVAIIAAVALIGVGIGWTLHQPAITLDTFGSVSRGSEYHSTTLVATTTFATLFKNGSGTFGGYVVNTLGTGNIVFKDASTTNSNLRTITATSSLRTVGVMDASQVAGDYVYDAYFQDGLIAVFSGTQGTSTVLWR